MSESPAAAQSQFIVFNDAVHARAALVNDTFALPPETRIAMKEIREVVAEAAHRIVAIAGRSGACDTGRLIAALDLLQQTKNVACDAVTLPHYVKSVKEDH